MPVIDIALWPTWGVLVLLALIAMHTAVIAGRLRRREWGKRVQHLEKIQDLATPLDLRRAERAERAADFFNLALRRIYYGVALLSALLLVGSPFLQLDAETLKILRLAFGSLSVGAAVLLAIYWYGWGDDRDSVLRGGIIRAHERSMAKQGLQVRDELTDQYTRDFWLHRLELETNRYRRKSLPISCLTFEVVSVEFARRQHGEQAAQQLLRRIVLAASQNVRGADLVCCYRGSRFVIALMRCSPRQRDRVGHRVANNLARYVLANDRYGKGHKPQVFWAGGTLFKDAQTPVQLLTLLDHHLEQKIREGVTPEYWERPMVVERSEIVL
ncbi:MAG: diguanylate cyclase [Chloroflexi bacterium]|nr:diguanylate cyclase [Chloroflexota bacterium]